VSTAVFELLLGRFVAKFAPSRAEIKAAGDVSCEHAVVRPAMFDIGE
jgi:hypothetical protein